jgi:dimethylhistidine N-methyltransferase
VSALEANAARDSLGAMIRDGLRAAPRSLSPVLFYDALGSALFDAITLLPEYYLTRTERGILDARADDIVGAALEGSPEGPCAVLELGAGSAEKSEVLLRALVRRRADVRFLPADVSPSALHGAAARLRLRLPEVHVEPLACTHGEALARAAAMGGSLIVLFIGSSIGNYDDHHAIDLLRCVHAALGPRGALVLGTDLRKPAEILVPAYDDPQGVTAAFNKNVLAHINRAYGGEFDLARFRHVAVWNDGASRMEMYLESVGAQRVRVRALDLDLRFADGERIHTESSHKYDDARVDAILGPAGLARAHTFTDAQRWFAVHVARAR